MRAFLFAFVLVGCGGVSRTDRSADAGDASPGGGGASGSGTGGVSSMTHRVPGDGSFPACSWPSRLDPSDAAPRGACHAARALLSCEFTSGVTQICVSNDPTKCPGSFQLEGGSVCRDECSPNEYAAGCGAIGPAPSYDSDPPAGCRLVEPTPAGIGFYCCPCS